MAHLARESEDWSTASALYEQVMAVAARIGQPDVELGARAGQALASLAVGARSVAEEAMRWIRTNVEPRPEWWFQGRDLVDALRIRLAAERGDEAHALRLLHEAVAIAGRYDPYARRISSPSARRRCAASTRRAARADRSDHARRSRRRASPASRERLSVLRVALGRRSRGGLTERAFAIRMLRVASEVADTLK